MTMKTDVPTSSPMTRERLGAAMLVLGGVAFVGGGVTHPGDSGTGSKIEQLHEMLADSMWYPSHALLLLGMVGFAAGILALRLRPGLPPHVQRVVRVAGIIAVVATAGMVVHLLEGLNAPHLADGEGNAFSTVQAVNETVVTTLWALGVMVLAVVGGLTRTIGNAITLALGLVGGAAFALAAATIAYTDLFDPLFALGSLLGVWAIAIGVGGLRRSR